VSVCSLLGTIFDILKSRAAHRIGCPLPINRLGYHVLVKANLEVAWGFHVDILLPVTSDPCYNATDFGLEVEYPHDDLPISRNPLIREPEDLYKLVPPNPAVGKRISGYSKLDCSNPFTPTDCGKISALNGKLLGIPW
jgi:hypothetical protein